MPMIWSNGKNVSVIELAHKYYKKVPMCEDPLCINHNEHSVDSLHNRLKRLMAGYQRTSLRDLSRLIEEHGYDKVEKIVNDLG